MVEHLLVIMYDFLRLTLGGVNTSYAQCNNDLQSKVLYSYLAVALLFWCQLYTVHAQGEVVRWHSHGNSLQLEEPQDKLIVPGVTNNISAAVV